MIGLVSINEDRNYGAVLQAVGLQEFLNKLGIESKFVCIDKDYNGVLKVSFSSAKNAIKSFFTIIHHKKLKSGCDSFQKFIEENQKCFSRFKNLEEIIQNPPSVKGYIVGSDQVWPESNLNPLYSLSFAEDSVIKISYAASLGKDAISEQKKVVYRDYLKRFNTISVREKTAIDTVSEVYDGSVEYHVDPTLLHSKKFWSHYEKPYKGIPSKYILVYMIYVPKDVNAQLKKIKEATGLPIVLISNTSYKNINCDYYIRDAGPAEFLWLYHNAQGIISSSYHGVIFSIIYKKPFIAVNNPQNGTRIGNLLSLLNLKNNNGWESSFLEQSCDFDSVEKIIKNEQIRSQKYLEDSLL